MTGTHADELTSVPDGRGSSASARREKRLLIVLAVNLAIVIGEAIADVIAQTVGLLADAGHHLTDVGGVSLALVAVR